MLRLLKARKEESKMLVLCSERKQTLEGHDLVVNVERRVLKIGPCHMWFQREGIRSECLRDSGFVHVEVRERKAAVGKRQVTGHRPPMLARSAQGAPAHRRANVFVSP